MEPERYVSNPLALHGLLNPKEKAGVIRTYAAKYGLDILIETGTYKGDTVAELLNDFRKIFSIEVGIPLYRESKKRFFSNPHVHIIQGDSGLLLAGLSVIIDDPCIYWLDAHWSGRGTWHAPNKKTPISEEMDGLMSLYEQGSYVKDSVILIDDARCFTEDYGYPPLEGFLKRISKILIGHDIDIKTDIIRITPKREK